MNRSSSWCALLAMAHAVGLSLLTGCASNPNPGNGGGRADPTRELAGDRTDAGALGSALWEYGDQVGERIAARIASAPQIKDSPVKVVIELGRIENRSAGTPSSDFDLLLRRVQSKLVNSDLVREHADIVERIESRDADAERFGSAQSGGVLDDGSGTGATGGARYDSQITYLLNGYFGEMVRGGGANSRYFFQIKLAHLASGRIIFDEPFELAQVRQ